jgi:signal transduction histidine kinase
VAFAPAPILGDRRLVERLVSNLLDNALRHNEPNGYVRLRVQTHADSSQLVITNGGPLVPADQVHRLLQPFQRLAPDRTAHSDGLGLGLSIVAAIATAHDATLEVEPGAYGGLAVEIRFPAAAPGAQLEAPVALPAPAPDVLPVIRS